MSIDWVTFAAQVGNFLVLVWLLHRFLYGPIVRAMDAREQKFVARAEELERATAEAQRRSAEYAERLKELEGAKETLMAEAAREVESWKEAELRAARAEIEQARDEWAHTLDREKETVLRELRWRIGQEVCALSRTVLRELCDASLEARAIERFRQQLESVDASHRAEIAHAIVNSRHRVLVATGFPLDERQRAMVTEMLHEYLAEGVEIEFAVQPDLVCGMEVKAAGYKVGWSGAEMLDEFEASFAAALDGAPSM